MDNMYYQNNSRNDEEERKKSCKATWKGVIIGACSAVLITVIAAGIFFSASGYRIQKESVRLSLGDEVADKMNTIKEYIDKYFLYDVDETGLDDAVYAAMLNGLDDKYARYYTAEEYKEMQESNDGVFSGIGCIVSQNPDTKVMTVVQTYKDSPAEKAGVQAGDVIIAVDGNDVQGMDIDAALSFIRGEEGTKVEVTFKRGEEELTYTIKRQKIDIITVEGRMLENDIGYIVISEFDGITKSQFESAFDELKSQGMKGLIVDIRDNPGGLLDVVSDILDKLLPEGLIVYTEDKYGHREEIKSDARCDLDIPCAVIVNGNSASASEIFSGALQDYGLAEIIGTQTFGKGIVQSMWKLSDGSAIKMTVENYYTPNGRCIHGTGITPDEVVEFDKDAYLNDGTDTQLNAAIDYITGQIGK